LHLACLRYNGKLHSSWVAIQFAGACMACINSQPYVISGPGLHCHLLHHLAYSPILPLKPLSEIRPLAAAALEIAGMLRRCLHAQLVKNPAKLLFT